MAPPLLKRQKSALLNKSFESDCVPSAQALLQPKSSGEQNTTQSKASADQNVPQHQKATYEVVKKVHGSNCNHKESLPNIIRWQVIDDLRCLESRHWSSGSLAGISRCFCRCTISVSNAQCSISQNQSANTRDCKSWMLLNAISNLRYWLRPKIYIVEPEDKYHSRMVGSWGTPNCCQSW